MCRSSHNSRNRQDNFCCQVCREPISRRRWRQHKCCQRIGCRNEIRRQWKKRDAEARQAWEQRTELRKQAAVSAVERQLNGISDAQPSSDQCVIVPALQGADRKPVNVAEKRKREFRDRLTDHLSAACAAQTSNSDEAVDTDKHDIEPDQIVQTACAACRGACCAQGENHAFVTAQTIRKFMLVEPQLRPIEIFHAYLDRIPNKSIVDSCIFHTPNGCALSREMRSTVCNEHLCGALKNLDDLNLDREQPIYVVAMTNENRPVRVHPVE